MSSILVAMSYLFCEIDLRNELWKNHFANIVYGIMLYKSEYFSIERIKLEI